MILKNIGFLIKNAPFAAKKAEDHLNKAIEIAKEINIDFDVMLETKMKDAALISLVNDLKSKSNYEWIDQSTFIVKKETFKSL